MISKRLALMFLVLACMALLAGSLAGCAAAPKQQEMAAPQAADSEEWRLRNLEAHFLEFQEEQQRQRADLEKHMALQNARLDKMREELEKRNQHTARLEAQVEVLQSSSSARETAMRSMAAPAKPEPMAAEKPKPMAMAPEKAPTKSEPMVRTMQPQAVEKPKPATKPMRTASKGTGSAEYDKGMALIRAEKTAEARAVFNDFLAAHPKHSLVPNALYWLGETYYHDKRYAQSILTFKEVARRFPKHDKAAAAMLKAGFAYDKLGDTSNARLYLETLVDEHPDSDPAALARTKLSQLPQ